MNRIGVFALTLAMLAMPVLGDGNLGCDGNDRYQNFGVLYVDDHLMNPSSNADNTFPAPYIYAETNGLNGLQREAPPTYPNPAAKPGDRGSSDGSGHCGFSGGEPDQWLL